MAGNVDPGEDQAAYRYPPLKEGHVRLLYLHPAVQGADLAGFLIHVPLDVAQGLQYHAISYVWGPKVFNKSILLNGRPLRITESLYSALKCFQELFVLGADHYGNGKDHMENKPFWADAICIHQADNDEKSQQVASMAKIFSMATKVEVWLGSETLSTKLALWMLECGSQYWDGNDNTPRSRPDFLEYYALWNERYGEEIQLPVSALSLHDARSIEIECFKAILELCNRRWFKRLWVLQEVVFSNDEDVLLRCGQSVISFHILRNFGYNYCMRGREWLNEHVLQQDSYHQLAESLLSLDIIADNENKASNIAPALRLLNFLLQLDGFQVSEQKDFIYAIRSLVFRDDEDYFLPDYNKSLEELWKEITIFFLEGCMTTHDSEFRENDLYSILAIPPLQMRSRMKSLPTWVLDLGAMDTYCLRKIQYYRAESTVQAAGGTHKMNAISWSDSRDTLLLSGHVLGQVETVRIGYQCPYDSIPAGYDILQWDEYFVRVATWALECAALLARERSSTEASTLKAFLAQGAYEVGKETTVMKLHSLFERHSEWLPASFDGCGLSHEDKAKLGEAIAPFFEKQTEIVHIDTARHIAISSDGRIGWVPEGTQLGDYVVLIKGGPFPFIMRHLDDEYFSIVGDAYISGIDQGEVCPADDDGWTTIAIK